MSPFLFVIALILGSCDAEREVLSLTCNKESQIPDPINTFVQQVRSHQSEHSLSFIFATDLHNQVYGETYSYSNNIIGKIKSLVYSINELNNWLDLSCVIIGGDYLWNTEKTSKVAAKEALQDFSESICDIKNLPILCLKGNHDDNSIAGKVNTLAQDELYSLNGVYFENSIIIRDARNPKGYYGYLDYPSEKTRIIYLNSIDIPWIEKGEGLKYKGIYHKGIQQKQLDFLKDALHFSESGWGVIIVSHHSVTSVKGYNTSDDTYITPDHGGSLLYGIIKAYTEKGVFHGEQEGDFASTVEVDYSNNASNTVICLLNGHIHCDRNAYFDNMLFCSTTSAMLGNIGSNTDGSMFTLSHNISDDFAFDVVTVDRANSMIYFDRFGFGESRVFPY